MRDLSDFAKAKVLDDIIGVFADKVRNSVYTGTFMTAEQLYEELLEVDAMVEVLDLKFDQLDTLIDLEVPHGETKLGNIRK